MAESDGVSKRFDPRFSRAFQPGYDARVHREEPPTAPLREDHRMDWSEVRAERPVFAIPESEETVIDDEAATDEGPLPWWRRVNPWFIVLWVIGVALIVSGASVMNFVIDLAGSVQQTGFDYVSSILMQSALSGAPTLIVLGLAILTSTIVILAARWRRS